MSYEGFCQRVSALLERVGGITAEITNDTDTGKFTAVCSDGTTITGNSKSLKATIRFGSGHQAQAIL